MSFRFIVRPSWNKTRDQDVWRGEPSYLKLALTMPDDTKTRQRVAREFILEKHMDAIERASIKGNFSISFRSAGRATLLALERGAAAKGHNILEKTIKQSSLAKAYGHTSSTGGHRRPQRAFQTVIDRHMPSGHVAQEGRDGKRR